MGTPLSETGIADQRELRQDPQEAHPCFGPQFHRSFRAPLEDDLAVWVLGGADPGQRADAFLGMVGHERQNGPVAGSFGHAEDVAAPGREGCAHLVRPAVDVVAQSQRP
ncbi:hypothetical protein ABT001_35900 [Streptomyces sp. NPDC002793]|uniref:hypothetical protein n=1 Tax=Streptomyces sp. NPDC002793 TaxID=3154432 RepID=UPI00332F1A1E